MIAPDTKQTIRDLCAGVNRELVEEFFSRMDEEYFAVFSPGEVAVHIRLSAELGPDRLVRVRIAAQEDDLFEIVIAGFDYHSEFSIFCGLLSAFSLDIRSGDIHSFSRGDSRRSARRIVDVFKVAAGSGGAFDEGKQEAFQAEVESFARLLAAGSAEEARARLNRFLVERIESANAPLSGLLAPLDLRFENPAGSDWTAMHSRSRDAFALLYALSNALSMRGISIHSVRIRSEASEVRDEFLIQDRWGRRIESEQEQQRLRTAVAMITEFTSFLPEAPDPALAMRHFDQLLDKLVQTSEEQFPDRTIAFLAAREGMHVLAQLLGSSDFLWNDLLRTHFGDLFPILERLAASAVPAAGRDAMQRELDRLFAASNATELNDRKAVLNRFKDRQAFLIDCRHLLEPHGTLLEFSRSLTNLAEVVVDEAFRCCRDHLVRKQGLRKAPGVFTMCGLGKFGGGEMGYASDMELLFVYEGDAAFFESLTHRIVDFIEAPEKGLFHIDLRLRPYGDAGPWATSFDRFGRYYSTDGEAAPFERQSLVKLRWVGGDEALGRRVEAARDAFSYSGAPWDLKDAIHLRRRQMRELVEPGRTNVKYSAGGIVDIEYAVQYLQLLNGAEHPEIRVPNTLQALNVLRRLQIVREADYETLHTAYFFLRNLIDALRIVRGHAGDLVLPEESSDEFKSLARRLNYGERDRNKAAALLSADVAEWMKRVHAYFAMRFEGEFSGDRS